MSVFAVKNLSDMPFEDVWYQSAYGINLTECTLYIRPTTLVLHLIVFVRTYEVQRWHLWCRDFGV